MMYHPDYMNSYTRLWRQRVRRRRLILAAKLAGFAALFFLLGVVW